MTNVPEYNSISDAYAKGLENWKALSDADHAATVAELRAKADAAERRLSEVREIQRTHYGDGVGLHLAMIRWARDYDAITGADPT